MNKEDMKADIEMSLKQIISIADLMLEHNNEISPNILTIRDLTQKALNKIINI